MKLELTIGKVLHYYQPQEEDFKSLLFKYSEIYNDWQKQKQEAEMAAARNRRSR